VQFIYFSVLMGAGATALLDLWALLLRTIFGFPLAPWHFVGRWFASMPKGTFVHPAGIAQTKPIANEKAIGWVMHYVVGMVFAAALLAIWGMSWTVSPRFLPALIVGLVTVGAGWFILQPGMGVGVACSKAAKPWQARMLNIVGHIVFAIGLYGMGLLLA
jgi:hypothetical protein